MSENARTIAAAQPDAQFRPDGNLEMASALSPYKGPWNSRIAAHLLRRAGFGGSPSEIRAATAAGMNKAVDGLLSFTPESLPEQPPGDISYTINDPKQRRQAVIITQLWWLNRLLLTQNPLHEKMVYFWSNHFTSAIIEGGITPAMIVGQYALFRQYALGNYARLTHEISKDPAMLLYLNGAQNRKGKPNENYARELMELFTLGVGNYSEEDIRQSARAFTGYIVDRLSGTAHLVPRLHDDGEKTFLGQTGNFSGHDVVDIIMRQPATGRFMARKFLRAFVYDDPEAALVGAVADKFSAHAYDVRILISILLRSNVFYSSRAYRALIKSPLDIVIGALKTVGATAVGPAVDGALARMDQVVMRPPNVAGWPGGSQWMNQSTLLARLNFLNQLVYYKPADRPTANGADQMDVQPATDMGMRPRAQAAMRAGIGNPLSWVAGANINEPSEVTERVLALALQGDVTPQQRSTVLRYLQTDAVGNLVPLNIENIDEKVRGATSLAFAMPSYQLM